MCCFRHFGRGREHFFSQDRIVTVVIRWIEVMGMFEQLRWRLFLEYLYLGELYIGYQKHGPVYLIIQSVSHRSLNSHERKCLSILDTKKKIETQFYVAWED